jgi:hypothetical protein
MSDLMSTAGMVSCHMVTRPERIEMAKQAILDFRDQVGPYNRELVFVCEAVDPGPEYGEWESRYAKSMETVRALIQFIREQDHEGAEIFRYCPMIFVRTEGHPQPTLGEMRNGAIASSHGDYWCQWDDDDRHHPERLVTQLAELHVLDQSVACFLTAQFYLDEKLGRMWWIDWTLAPTQGSGIYIPGTVLCKAGPYRYPAIARGEDTAFYREVAAAGPVIGVPPYQPWLYIRRWHGGNTSPRSLRDANIKQRSRPFGDIDAYLRDIEFRLRQFRWHGRRKIILAGRRGGSRVVMLEDP